MSDVKIPVAPLGADAATADDFQVYSAPSLVRFLSRGVQPPSQIYLKHTDTLQVQCASSQTGESVTFNYRLLRADGSLVKGQFVIQVPATRAVVTQKEPMAEGFLLSLSCKAAVAVTRGETFARVYLTSGALGANQPSYTLMGDYVTTQFAPAHPNGRVLAPNEGPGRIFSVSLGAFGLGVPAQFFVPTNARWLVKAIESVLVTSAAAGNRIPQLSLSVGGFSIAVGFAEVNIPPSTNAIIFANPVRAVPVSSPTVVWLGLPDGVVMLAGDNGQINPVGLLAGDQFTALVVTVEEWLDNV